MRTIFHISVVQVSSVFHLTSNMHPNKECKNQSVPDKMIKSHSQYVPKRRIWNQSVPDKIINESVLRY